VPFFRASLYAGGITIILLFTFLSYTDLNVLGLILAPGLAHLYNNWKWPHEAFSQLCISKKDIKNLIIEYQRKLI
jgi:hypothetical protein